MHTLPKNIGLSLDAGKGAMNVNKKSKVDAMLYRPISQRSCKKVYRELASQMLNQSVGGIFLVTY